MRHSENHRTSATQLVSLFALPLLVLASAACSGGNVKTIVVTPSSKKIDNGSTLQLVATATFRDGTTEDISATAEWSSSDPLVATVASSGLVTAGLPGSVTITASAEGASGSASLSVAGFMPVQKTLLDAPSGYVDQPVVAMDGAGRLLVAYGISEPSYPFRTAKTGTEWPPVWTGENSGVTDAWPTSGADVEMASNATGIAGMVYRRRASPSASSADFYSIGVAYHDLTGWRWVTPLQGSLLLQWGQEPRTPVVEVDPAGTIFVAYQDATPTYALDTLAVARFGPAGLIDVTRFSEKVGRIYVAANDAGQVMVLNTLTGSRVFDGGQWGDLKPFTVNIADNARLTLFETGSAMLLVFDEADVHFAFDGSSWSAGERLNGFDGGGGSGATDATGRAVVAWGESTGMKARVFDGASWGDPVTIEANRVGNPSVVTNGSGTFVVLWDIPFVAIRGTWFDGVWHHPANVLPSGVFLPMVKMRSGGRIAIVHDDAAVYDSLFAWSVELRP